MRTAIFMVLLTFATGTSLLSQQPVTVDWTTKGLGVHPATVERDTDVVIRVEHVNDILFAYSISLTGTPRDNFDSALIANAFQLAGKGAAEGVGCDQRLIDGVTSATKILSDSINTFFKLPETITTGCSASAPCSVTLDQARQHWRDDTSSKLINAQDKQDEFSTLCRAQQYAKADEEVLNMLKKAHDLEGRLKSDDHVVTKNDVLKPDTDYVLSITQLYLGIPTKDGTATLQLKPNNNRLTLSAGALFSEVQNRSYATVAAPDPNGTGTKNILSVGGISTFSPTSVALLNYQIPRFDFDSAGLAFSTGPVFRLGSKSDVSSFGYFVGASIHLFHRVFVTPGFHLGEFADFPPGFTQVNQQVPAGFTTPIPVKRWTWRFGVAVSYKAKDFKSFGITGDVTSGTKTSTSTKNPTADTSPKSQ